MKDPKPALDGAKVALTRERIRQIDIALAQHKVQNGVYPADLTALTEGKNPLKAESLIDPWGLLCQYDPTGPKNKGAKPDVWTVAPDKTVIGNWKEAKE
jgi:hypothetical protein